MIDGGLEVPEDDLQRFCFSSFLLLKFHVQPGCRGRKGGRVPKPGQLFSIEMEMSRASALDYNRPWKLRVGHLWRATDTWRPMGLSNY